jgi:hypothetical protein
MFMHAETTREVKYKLIVTRFGFPGDDRFDWIRVDSLKTEVGLTSGSIQQKFEIVGEPHTGF